ncbi:MAG: hypothetical protein OEZ34_10665 [Spirochaetia bacterium]|nr:hypothetical protein [Spirochaetia bacterium]
MSLKNITKIYDIAIKTFLVIFLIIFLSCDEPGSSGVDLNADPIEITNNGTSIKHDGYEIPVYPKAKNVYVHENAFKDYIITPSILHSYEYHVPAAKNSDRKKMVEIIAAFYKNKNLFHEPLGKFTSYYDAENGYVWYGSECSDATQDKISLDIYSFPEDDFILVHINMPPLDRYSCGS